MHGITAEVAWVDGDRTYTRTFPLGLKLNLTPVAGDWVELDPETGIKRVLERRTALLRPAADGAGHQVLAANIDLIMIVLSVVPGFNVKALERFLVMAAGSGAEQLVVLSKADLATDLAATLAEAESGAPNHEVVVTSAFDGRGLPELRARLTAGTTATLFGPSGAGKTSLLNALEQRDELVREVGTSGEGRHATTTRRLYTLANGGVLLDLPGIRNLDVIATEEALDETFSGITELAAGCRFSDCAHDREPGCAVRDAIGAGELDASRLQRWQEIRGEIAAAQSRGGPRKGSRRKRSP